MSDAKKLYSDTSKHYIENDVVHNTVDQERYKRCKDRENKFNENWKKQKVNLNEIVDQYAPDGRYYKQGYKFVYEGARYKVIADMNAGYVRIFDKKLKSFCLLDGQPSDSRINTHFKIKKREEM